MFSVTVDGVEYKVDFNHTVNRRGNRVTECSVTVDNQESPVRVGSVTCYATDRYNKAIGRQLSLDNAMWFDYKVLPFFPTEVRAAIYNKYFSMSKPVSIKRGIH